MRADSHAQYEIRVYADIMCELAKAWVPYAYEAFEDYRLGGLSLSRLELALVKRGLAGEPIAELIAGSDLSAREKTELCGKLGLS